MTTQDLITLTAITAMDDSKFFHFTQEKLGLILLIQTRNFCERVGSVICFYLVYISGCCIRHRLMIKIVEVMMG